MGPDGAAVITFPETAGPPGDTITAWPEMLDEVIIVPGADVAWIHSTAEVLAVASWPVTVFWAAPHWDVDGFLGPRLAKLIKPGAIPNGIPAIVAGGYPAGLARGRLHDCWHHDGDIVVTDITMLSPTGDVDCFLAAQMQDLRLIHGLVYNLAQVLALDASNTKVRVDREEPSCMVTMFAPEMERPLQVILDTGAADVYGYLLRFDLAHCQAGVAAATGVIFSAAALSAWVSGTTWITTPKKDAGLPHMNSLVRLAVAIEVLGFRIPSREAAALLTKYSVAELKAAIEKRCRPKTFSERHTHEFQQYVKNSSTAAKLTFPAKFLPLAAVFEYDEERKQIPSWAYQRCLRAWASLHGTAEDVLATKHTFHGYISHRCINKTGEVTPHAVIYVTKLTVRQLQARVEVQFSAAMQAAIIEPGVTLFKDGFCKTNTRMQDEAVSSAMFTVPCIGGVVARKGLHAEDAAVDAAGFRACRNVLFREPSRFSNTSEPWVYVPVTATMQGWSIYVDPDRSEAPKLLGVLVGFRFGHV
jgi:hypothetical protein